MEKTDLKGYLEFFCHLPKYKLNADLKDLVIAADESQIHTFGWPIGVVLHTKELKPKPISQDKIRVIVDKDLFDLWTLDKKGNYYILKSLFEDRRGGNAIFFDTRTIRTTELFLRTARLYKALSVPENEVIECKLEYGGLLNRVLGAANPNRIFIEQRKCTINEVSKTFREPIVNFLNERRLKEIVYEVLKAITEGCDMFEPPIQEINNMIDEFLNGRII